MLKQIGLLILLSLLAALLLHELHPLFSLFIFIHNIFYHMLGIVVSDDWLGRVLRQTIVFILVPLFIAFIPALIHKLLRRTWLTETQFMFIAWLSWVVIVILTAH